VAFQIDSDASVARVRMQGEITETADFAPILSEHRPKVVLDLAEVQRINSCGVREWINFMNALSKAGSEIVLEKCSVPIVNQLNMISNFKGTGAVTSVFAPYFCDSCNKDHMRLLEVAPGIKEKILEPVMCPTCSNPMEFDDLLDSF